MKAMVYTAPLELKILDVDIPEPHDGEVLVRVRAAGICGSELEGVASRSAFRVPPLIMGHEFVGDRVDTGDLVIVNPVVSCRNCDLCLRGFTNLCRERAILGIQRAGGFAEYVAVPEANCYPAPAGAAPEVAVFTEPLANSIHAFRMVQEHDALPLRVGVIGAGPLGFLVAMTAARSGVAEVVISDLSESRRELAMSSGATEVVTRLEGEFDAIFDAVGSEQTRRASIELIRSGGTAVWIGLHGAESGVDGVQLIRGEKRVIGSFCYQDVDYRTAIARLASMSPHVTTSVPLDEGVGAFERRMHNGDLDTLKTILLPS